MHVEPSLLALSQATRASQHTLQRELKGGGGGGQRDKDDAEDLGVEGSSLSPPECDPGIKRLGKDLLCFLPERCRGSRQSHILEVTPDQPEKLPLLARERHYCDVCLPRTPRARDDSPPHGGWHGKIIIPAHFANFGSHFETSVNNQTSEQVVGVTRAAMATQRTSSFDSDAGFQRVGSAQRMSAFDAQWQTLDDHSGRKVSLHINATSAGRLKVFLTAAPMRCFLTFLVTLPGPVAAEGLLHHGRIEGGLRQRSRAKALWNL